MTSGCSLGHMHAILLLLTRVVNSQILDKSINNPNYVIFYPNKPLRLQYADTADTKFLGYVLGILHFQYSVWFDIYTTI